jgi:arginyl-tRNA synthetase
MQSITSQLDRSFRIAIRDSLGIDADPLISVSQNAKFGDYQSNAAMGLARTLSDKTGQKRNPRAVAEQIMARLDLGFVASEITIAGPGFINIRLRPAWLSEQLGSIERDDRLGIEPVAQPQNVVIDYSSPNIAKEMHVGHIRSTIIGDAVARVISFQGHHVIQQNHIGDWGTQFGMLIAFLRSTPSAAQGDAHIADLEAFYRDAKRRFDDDQQFQDEARRTVVQLQAGSTEERVLWRKIVAETRNHYQPLYDRMGVLLKPEHERGESFYNDLLPSVVGDLKQKGLAELSEGAIVVKVAGSENPLIIEKSAGGYLYGTTDLAAIRFRVQELHADRIIYFVDARQSQHFAQVYDVARRAGWAPAGVSLEHAAFGTILGEDGKPFKTRSGETVKLKDLLDEAEERAMKLVSEKNPDLPDHQRRNIAHAVGIGAIKYADLSKDRVSDYVFSWDKMLAMDGNTGPYLQYAYARIRSIFRKAGSNLNQADVTILLDSPHELALAKHVLRLGEIIDLVARELKPHYLCTYLYELATHFSGFYENCPVLQSEEPTRSSRLKLADLTARTLALGLDLLGIEHPEQM